MRILWTCLALVVVLMAACDNGQCDASLIGRNTGFLPTQPAGSPSFNDAGLPIQDTWGRQIAGDLPYFDCDFRCHFQPDTAAGCQGCTPDKAATPYFLGGSYSNFDQNCGGTDGTQVCHIWERGGKVVGVDLRCYY